MLATLTKILKKNLNPWLAVTRGSLCRGTWLSRKLAIQTAQWAVMWHFSLGLSETSQCVPYILLRNNWLWKRIRIMLLIVIVSCAFFNNTLNSKLGNQIMKCNIRQLDGQKRLMEKTSLKDFATELKPIWKEQSQLSRNKVNTLYLLSWAI